MCFFVGSINCIEYIVGICASRAGVDMYLAEFPQKIGKVDMIVLVERALRGVGLREEEAFACNEYMVEIDAYCTCIECRIAWW